MYNHLKKSITPSNKLKIVNNNLFSENSHLDSSIETVTPHNLFSELTDESATYIVGGSQSTFG